MRNYLLSRKKAFLALLVPFFSLFLFLKLTAFPLHLLNFPDPDYFYFFNALLPFQGKPPCEVDHPGTPLQLLGTVILFVRYLLGHHSSSVTQDFFRHPVQYHAFALSVTFGIFFLAQWWSGMRLLTRHRLPIVLIVQALPLIPFEAVRYLSHFSPETLMAAAGLCLVTVLAEANESNNHWQGIATGLLLALLVSLKAHALLLLPLVFCLPRKLWLKAGISFLGFFFCFTCVVADRYPQMATWLTSLLVHSGYYGQGKAEAVTIAQLYANWQTMFIYPGMNLVLFFALLFPLLLLVPGKGDGRKRFLLFFLGALVIYFLLKHPAQRYLVVCPPLLALAVIRLERLKMVWSYLLSVGVLGSLCFLYVPWVNLFAAGNELNEKSIRNFESKLLTDYPTCNITVFNVLPIPAFTLYSGQLATCHRDFSSELESQFPHYRFQLQSMTDFQNYHGSIQEKEWAAFVFAQPCHFLAALETGSEAGLTEVFGEKPISVETISYDTGKPAQFHLYRLGPQTEKRLKALLSKTL